MIWLAFTSSPNYLINCAHVPRKELMRTMKPVNSLMIKTFRSNIVFSRVLRDSTPRFVGLTVRPLVRWSVTLYFFLFFAVFGLAAPALKIK